MQDKTCPISPWCMDNFYFSCIQNLLVFFSLIWDGGMVINLTIIEIISFIHFIFSSSPSYSYIFVGELVELHSPLTNSSGSSPGPNSPSSS